MNWAAIASVAMTDNMSKANVILPLDPPLKLKPKTRIKMGIAQ
jgi:hypothetical protein